MDFYKIREVDLVSLKKAYLSFWMQPIVKLMEKLKNLNVIAPIHL